MIFQCLMLSQIDNAMDITGFSPVLNIEIYTRVLPAFSTQRPVLSTAKRKFEDVPRLLFLCVLSDILPFLIFLEFVGEY